MFKYCSVCDFFILFLLFTANIALSKTTTSQMPDRTTRGPELAVDGTVSGGVFSNRQGKVNGHPG